jgi:non-heme chloroperoxidase
MSTITTKDGAQIYFKDWGKGPVVTFSHGWPLNSDAWDGQMLFLAQNGFRVVAHDRRGHGRSSQAFSGNDMDGYADDLAAVIEALDLEDATLVGHSTGGGEVARYIGRHGTMRVAKAVLVAAVPPVLRGEQAGRQGFAGDAGSVLALEHAGRPQERLREHQGILGDRFHEDLKKFDVPTLVMHGEDDQIVPVKDSARKSARLIKGAKEIYDPGAPHGLTATHQDQVNADLLAFLRS